jgi:hypothetical protein
MSDRPYFGGEVALGSGTLLRKSKGETSITHTGDAVVSLSGTGTAFVYKTNDVRLQTYRAKVWTNATTGKIYYKINGGAEVLSTAISTKVGNWYLLSLDIPVTAAISSLEVGVRASSGTVLFDDFRFQPLQSSMTCYVYPPPGFDYANVASMASFDYVLNNDNLYTKYEYNEQGRVVRTYQESIQYGEKLISGNNVYYKRTDK